MGRAPGSRPGDDDAPRPRVLIVEDEAKTASTVALYLRHAGIDVEVALDGTTGLEKGLGGGQHGAFDLVILDVLLPGVDGREICRRLRAESNVPIVMVTARATEGDRIDGLDLGADDYVTKPFSPRELVARVRANLRRAGLGRASGEPEIGSEAALRRGALEIDRDRHDARLEGRPLGLTAAELELLAALAERPGIVWSRERLLARLPASGPAGDLRDARTVDAHVKNLRRKMEPDRRDGRYGQGGRRPRWVRTVFGAGYQLVLPEEPDGSKEPGA